MSRRLLLALPLLLTACSERPRFDPDAVRAARLGAGLPPGFMLGTSTSSHQVEGGNENQWSAWERGQWPDGRPHIKDGTVSGEATDSWNRFDEDVRLIQRLGSNAYRFGLEWSRLQPTQDTWDEEALARYTQWARTLRQNGITPLVTLYHFTLPNWVVDTGGWENPATIDAFEAYTARVAEAMGGEVDWWCTVNEPNVYAVLGYLDAEWPPGRQDEKATATVLSHLIEAHARAARQLRQKDTVDADGDSHATRIGLAHHVRVFQPATGSAVDTTVAGLTDAFFNESVPEALRTGRIRLSIPGSVSLDREVEGLKGSIDYFGINYYTRDYVRQYFGEPSLSRQYVPRGREKNDLGWDLYPEGLYLFLTRYAKLGLPLLVTENGMADHTGERRPYYLQSHIYAVEQARAAGADVRGYFHWSLLDNFEWAEGYEPKFGLFSVDLASPEKTRQDTPAVATFQEIARNLGLTPSP
ncbi:glycoside hydrolase family 1 protein [Hyalangium rubrum]|uniref:Glycoside hydrolase family 1 protein n=1 Tax=Hyalangium rubrum TaxID=3103134 RepID=A0ABU5H943_9BACT|nr:glycoside hydrolase family 1 protein [Hyalangium sp. s54d21]MDY7229999.1 glycoside hydrolase family 1 protein [Hyalangium sp. s54d21]